MKRFLSILILVLFSLTGCLTVPNRSPELDKLARQEWGYIQSIFGRASVNFPVVILGKKSEWFPDQVTVRETGHLRHELMHQFVYSGEHLKTYKGKVITVEGWR